VGVWDKAVMLFMVERGLFYWTVGFWVNGFGFELDGCSCSIVVFAEHCRRRHGKRNE